MVLRTGRPGPLPDLPRPNRPVGGVSLSPPPTGPNHPPDGGLIAVAAYIAARLAQAVPVAFIASLAVFLVVRLVPGDPAELVAGEDAPPERVTEIRHDLGLDRPVLEQYADWAGGLFRGDLGISLQNGQPVSRLLGDALPPTVELAVVAYPVALVLGIAIGGLAGMRPGSPWDWFATAYAGLCLAVPGFLLAILLLWFFAISLGWLPASGRESILADPLGGLRTVALPAASLAFGISAVLVRYTRTAVVQAQSLDFVRTARAKGLGERAVFMQHALRNALLPIITVGALQVGHLLSGAVVVEQVFTRPGMGRLMVHGIQHRDYPVVQGGILVLVAIFIGVNLAADIAYGLADPRVRGAR